MALHIKDSDQQAVFEHSRAGYPHEACGLFGGNESFVKTFYPMTNVAASGTVYLLDSREQLEVMQAMDDAGEELIGIYHSHVASEAFPSPTDIKQAFYPDSAYVIVSLEDLDKPDMKAFTIVDGTIGVEEIKVIEGE